MPSTTRNNRLATDWLVCFAFAIFFRFSYFVFNSPQYVQLNLYICGRHNNIKKTPKNCYHRESYATAHIRGKRKHRGLLLCIFCFNFICWPLVLVWGLGEKYCSKNSIYVRTRRDVCVRRGSVRHQKCQLLSNIVVCDMSFDCSIQQRTLYIPHWFARANFATVEKLVASWQMTRHWPTIRMPKRERQMQMRTEQQQQQKNVNCIPSIYLFVYLLHFHFLLPCRVFIAILACSRRHHRHRGGLETGWQQQPNNNCSATTYLPTANFRK